MLAESRLASVTCVLALTIGLLVARSPATERLPQVAVSGVDVGAEVVSNRVTGVEREREVASPLMISEACVTNPLACI